MTEIIKASDFGLEEKQAVSIEKAFAPKISEREGLVPVYESLLKKEINEETCKEAGDLRRKLVKIRTGISQIHKTQKAYALAFGKFCDAWKNKETAPVEQMEENLMQIEKHYELKEKERLERLQAERSKLLSPYVEDAEERNLSAMDDDVWDAYFQAKKKAHEEKVIAEKKAEEERIAKEIEENKKRERIRLENIRLKKEAEERERRAKIEAEKRAKEEAERKAKQEAERKAREEKERKEREAYEAKLKAEREEKERIEREEKAKREKLEAELKAKQEAERKAKEEEEAKRQAELNKCDADKVRDLIAELGTISSKYEFKSAKNKKMYRDVGLLIDKVIAHIKK